MLRSAAQAARLVRWRIMDAAGIPHLPNRAPFPSVSSPWALLLGMQGLARAQTRGFAEKAVAAEVDWDAISNLVHSDEGKRELVSLRTTFLDIQSRLTGMSKATAPPNWAEWSKELDPKIVDGFKKAFESESQPPKIPVPANPSPSPSLSPLPGMALPAYQGNDVAAAESRFMEIIAQAEVLAADSAARVTEIKAELAGIETEKARIATMTVDEELAADPALAAEIDADVEKNSFLVTP
jgi:hypothetical protein